MSGGSHQIELLPAPAPSEAERAATCALAGLKGIGLKSLAVLRAAHGSLAKAVAKGGPEIARTPELRLEGAKSLAETPELERRGEQLLAQARQLGAQVLLHGEPGYPSLLFGIQGAPPVLYVLGTLAPETRRAAIVGSRQSDDYGLSQARAVVARLVAAGVEVVSGGADGVDVAVHERTLELGGRTVAVLGSGLLAPYPAHNRPLYERIAGQGAVVSEFALDAGGNKQHFPQRNRTIAGLCQAVCITRGTLQSGALSTCDAARRLSRPVFATPGRVDDPLAQAPNLLLSEGAAKALVDGNQVVQALGLAAQPSPATLTVQPVPEGLPEGERRLVEALGPAPRHVDELAQQVGTTAGEALAALLNLELAGLCVARPGMYFLRR